MLQPLIEPLPAPLPVDDYEDEKELVAENTPLSVGGGGGEGEGENEDGDDGEEGSSKTEDKQKREDKGKGKAKEELTSEVEEGQSQEDEGKGKAKEELSEAEEWKRWLTPETLEVAGRLSKMVYAREWLELQRCWLGVVGCDEEWFVKAKRHMAEAWLSKHQPGKASDRSWNGLSEAQQLARALRYQISLCDSTEELGFHLEDARAGYERRRGDKRWWDELEGAVNAVYREVELERTMAAVEKMKQRKAAAAAAREAGEAGGAELDDGDRFVLELKQRIEDHPTESWDFVLPDFVAGLQKAMATRAVTGEDDHAAATISSLMRPMIAVCRSEEEVEKLSHCMFEKNKDVWLAQFLEKTARMGQSYWRSIQPGAAVGGGIRQGGIPRRQELTAEEEADLYAPPTPRLPPPSLMDMFVYDDALSEVSTEQDHIIADVAQEIIDDMVDTIVELEADVDWVVADIVETAIETVVRKAVRAAEKRVWDETSGDALIRQFFPREWELGIWSFKHVPDPPDERAVWGDSRLRDAKRVYERMSTASTSPTSSTFPDGPERHESSDELFPPASTDDRIMTAAEAERLAIHSGTQLMPDTDGPPAVRASQPRPLRDDEILVYVVLPGRLIRGNPMPVAMRRPGAITRVKAVIEFVERIPCGKQRLAFASQLLEDGRSLEDYGIASGSTLQLGVVGLVPEQTGLEG